MKKCNLYTSVRTPKTQLPNSSSISRVFVNYPTHPSVLSVPMAVLFFHQTASRQHFAAPTRNLTRTLSENSNSVRIASTSGLRAEHRQGNHGQVVHHYKWHKRTFWHFHAISALMTAARIQCREIMPTFSQRKARNPPQDGRRRLLRILQHKTSAPVAGLQDASGEGCRACRGFESPSFFNATSQKEQHVWNI